MCGRYAFYSPEEAVTRLFPVADCPPIEPRYNIAPTQFVPAIRQERDAKPALVMLRWGLIPSWAKEKSIGNRMINARAETVQQKPAYRSAFRRRRCLVLANGFYEWKAYADAKRPFYISMSGDEPFAMAGLWEHWHDPETDSPLHSCTIVTTEPNQLLATIHNRMPVIVPRKDQEAWLDPAYSSRDGLQAMLAPYPSDAMKAHRVSRVVNNARNEGADLVRPAEDDNFAG